MRKITRDAVGAFLRGELFRKGNTYVSLQYHDGMAPIFTLALHDNPIARWRSNADGFGDIEISLAGWGTKLTRSRLNGIPGISVYQRNGSQYLNGCEIDANEWYPVKVAEYMFSRVLHHGG